VYDYIINIIKAYSLTLQHAFTEGGSDLGGLCLDTAVWNGLGAWLLRVGLVLSPVAVNLTLALVTFLVCRHGFVHHSFFVVWIHV